MGTQIRRIVDLNLLNFHRFFLKMQLTHYSYLTSQQNSVFIIFKMERWTALRKSQFSLYKCYKEKNRVAVGRCGWTWGKACMCLKLKEKSKRGRDCRCIECVSMGIRFLRLGRGFKTFKQRHSYCLSPFGLLSQIAQIVWLTNKRCFLLTVLGAGKSRIVAAADSGEGFLVHGWPSYRCILTWWKAPAPHTVIAGN